MARNEKTGIILIVEDEAIISIITANAIKKFGYEVLSANSGEKAVELAVADSRISLVLMDINLGDGIDGTEAARQILAVRSLPIVFHTSHSEKDMVEKVKGITRYGYVIKSSGDFVLNSSIEMAYELFEANRNIEESMDALRESEEKYRAAFMTSPDAVNINAMDGTYVDINDGFTKLTGFTREDVIGVLSSEIKIWHIPDDRVRLVKGLTETGYVENLESVFRRKDGTLTTALMSARIIKIKNEPHILSITRDISERKRYEEEIKSRNEELGSLNEELNAAIEELEATNEEFETINGELQKRNYELRKSEDKYRLLIENSHDIIYTLSAEGIFTFVSPAWTTLVGNPVDEVTGQSFKPFVHPDDVQSCMTWLREVIESGKRLEGIEYRVKNIDGKWYWHTSSAVPVRDDSGAVTGFVGIARDITERKLTDEKIKSLLAEKELLLREVHHRIKNNMNTIIGLLTLQALSVEEPSAAAALDDAQNRIHSMMVLYDKLYRSDDFGALSLKEYLPALIDEIAGNFEIHGTVKFDNNIEDFDVDTKILFPLGIIVNEIITNAMKYAFSGMDNGLLTISASRTENRALIEIGDNGAGIPDSVDFENSSGFGLSLLTLLTEQIGGTIRLERENGTKFILEFDL